MPRISLLGANFVVVTLVVKFLMIFKGVGLVFSKHPWSYRFTIPESDLSQVKTKVEEEENIHH